MSLTGSKHVWAYYNKDALGAYIAPAAGLVPAADGAGGANWSASGGGGVTAVTNAGGSVFLANLANPAIPAIKGLTGGPGIVLTDNGTFVTIAESNANATGGGGFSSRRSCIGRSESCSASPMRSGN